MNVHDSEQIEKLLQGMGYKWTDDESSADLIIINTCGIREKAEQKVYSLLGRLKYLKKVKPGLIIGVGGCVAQQNGHEFLTRVPHLDLVFGTHAIHRLPEMVEGIRNSGCRVVDTAFRDSVQSLGIVAPPRNGAVSAYITIMQGCDNFCSYCVVPYLRGREESRSVDDIIREIECLKNHGVREITLLGQNVNSYGNTFHGGSDFPALLRAIGKVDGIERIRFTTSHPKDLSDELMDCFASVGTLCEHIHLPVQSGSDYVLERMNRKYTSGDYLKRVEQLRDVCPHISITSDFIVGFPGESDEDFQRTLDVMERVRFDNSFSFKYSFRPGTAAATMDGHVDERIKSERLSVLQSLQNIHTQLSNQADEGKVKEVLVEGFSKNDRTDVTGRTRTNKIVNFRGNIDMVGTVVSVKIIEGYAHSLRGEATAEEREKKHVG